MSLKLLALRALSCGAGANLHSCVVSMEIHVVPVAIVGTRETHHAPVEVGDYF